MEAWQKREAEQQQFLEELHREIMDAVETATEKMGESETQEYIHLLKTADFLLRALIRQGQGRQKDWREVFVNPFIEKIENFARTPEESKVLQERLLKKVLESGLTKIHGEYLHQSVHEPEKLYEGHKTMDEVEFD